MSDKEGDSVADVLKAWLALASGVGMIALVNLTTVFGRADLRAMVVAIGTVLTLCGGCGLM